MIDSDFGPFEGMWLISPSGSVACAKVFNSELLIPYALAGQRKLAGHFRQCRVIGKIMVARFERFGSSESGVLRLSIGEDSTLKGGWWADECLPDKVRNDISMATEDLIGMVQTVWVRMPKARTPVWAANYFLEWSPNR